MQSNKEKCKMSFIGNLISEQPFCNDMQRPKHTERSKKSNEHEMAVFNL